MDLRNNEETSKTKAADIERIREANRYKNISLYNILHLAFITKYAPHSVKRIYEEVQPDGSTEVLVEWENVLSKYKGNISLPEAVKVITASYAVDQVIEEFESFKKTSKRRINRFLDTLLGQKDCIKQFFPDGFSQLQSNDLIHVLLFWESEDYESFCREEHEKVSEDIRNYIEDYVFDFVVGGLEDKFNPYELSALWHQKLEFPYETKIQVLKEVIESELNQVKDLIWASIDPKPQAEDMATQLKFLWRCLRLIRKLKEKIIMRSDYMKKTMAEDEDKLLEEIHQQITEKHK